MTIPVHSGMGFVHQPGGAIAAPCDVARSRTADLGADGEFDGRAGSCPSGAALLVVATTFATATLPATLPTTDDEEPA